MKTSLLRTLSLATLMALSAVGASAQIVANFNFDSVPSGSLANFFSTSAISFHEAWYVPFTDSFGDPIAGSDHWEIDSLNDGLYPVTVENPFDYGYGVAPSGSNALQALWQPVLITFDQPYNLEAFSVTLDNSTFGFSFPIAFISGSATLSELLIDQSIAGLTVNVGGLTGVTGIVLPSGAFYDNLSLRLNAVPEPSTWGLIAGATCLGAVMLRRRLRRT